MFRDLGFQTWEFPKIRVTLFGGPYNNTIWGTILGSPIFGNAHLKSWELKSPQLLMLLSERAMENRARGKRVSWGLGFRVS